MLPASQRTRGRTKNQESATKKWAELLPGHVERRMVKCGKQSCKCARGKLHGPYYYHVFTVDYCRQRRYIRRSEVPEVLGACRFRREFNREMRRARAFLRNMLARATRY